MICEAAYSIFNHYNKLNFSNNNSPKDRNNNEINVDDKADSKAPQILLNRSLSGGLCNVVSNNIIRNSYGSNKKDKDAIKKSSGSKVNNSKNGERKKSRNSNSKIQNENLNKDSLTSIDISKKNNNNSSTKLSFNIGMGGKKNSGSNFQKYIKNVNFF